MKSIKKRLLILLTVLSLCACFTTTAFAAETPKNDEGKCYTFEVTSEGITAVTDETGNEITPRSSISGYNQASISGNPAAIIVYPSSSGWGGMGVTVKASSSWSGYMNLDILGSDGSTPLQGKAVYSNSETKVNNLYHKNPSYYMFSFRGIPSGKSVYVQIWIYG